MKGALVELWGEIRGRMSESDSRFLGEIYPGPLTAGDDHAWAQTNRDDEHQDVVNLTLEISSSDLQLNLVGGTTPQREQLEQWLKVRGSSFWRSHPAWQLVVFHRKALGSGFWMNAPWLEIARYSAAEMSKKGIVTVRSDHGFGLDTDHVRLAYHVRRSWTRDAVLAPGEDLVPTLVSAVEEIFPHLREARVMAV